MDALVERRVLDAGVLDHDSHDLGAVAAAHLKAAPIALKVAANAEAVHETQET